MVVCKFFLQGECRFGENCRFEHQLGSAKTGNQPFGNNQTLKKIFNPKTGTEIELGTLLYSVQNDVTLGDKGRQWLLTCYAPFKEKPLYPGFIDMSFEEVRFGYFEAKKSNSVEQYNQRLQQLLAEAQARYRSLQNPTKEIVEMLKNIYNNDLNSISVNNQNFFPEKNIGFGSNTISIFGQTSQEKSGVYGQSASVFGQQNTLGGSASVFGLQNSGSAFGQQKPSNSIFGQPGSSSNTGSIFGQQQPTIFQQQMNATQKDTTVFGQQKNSIFGQSGNVLNQQHNGSFVQQSGSIFGQQSMIPSNTSIFPKTNSSHTTGNLFGQQNPPQNTGNIFGQQNTNQNNGNVFGQQSISQNTGSVFGQQQNKGDIFSNQNNAQSNTNIFGQQTHSQNTLFGQQNNAQSSGNIFGQQNNSKHVSSIFGQNSSVQSGASIFGQEKITQSSNKSSIFGIHQSGVSGNPQQQNMVSQNSNQLQQSIFGIKPEQTNIVNQNSTSVFQATNSSLPHATSIFGLPASNASISQKDNKSEIRYNAYSKQEDLTEEEIQWFNSDVFDLYKIPEKPPTYEMCF